MARQPRATPSQKTYASKYERKNWVGLKNAPMIQRRSATPPMISARCWQRCIRGGRVGGGVKKSKNAIKNVRNRERIKTRLSFLVAFFRFLPSAAALRLLPSPCGGEG